MTAINKAANLAVLIFKALIVIACMSIPMVLIDKMTSVNTGVLGFTPLFVCNVVVASTYMIAGAIFVLWFFVAYKKLYEQRPEDLRYTPKWTILGFSLPVVNLFMPYILVGKMWKQLATWPDNYVSSYDSENRLLPGYINMWWLSHLIYFIGLPLFYVVLSNSTGIQHIDNLEVLLSIFSYLIVCNTARFAMRLVKTLNTRLTEAR